MQRLGKARLHQECEGRVQGSGCRGFHAWGKGLEVVFDDGRHRVGVEWHPQHHHAGSGKSLHGAVESGTPRQMEHLGRLASALLPALGDPRQHLHRIRALASRRPIKQQQ